MVGDPLIQRRNRIGTSPQAASIRRLQHGTLESNSVKIPDRAEYRAGAMFRRQISEDTDVLTHSPGYFSGMC